MKYLILAMLLIAAVGTVHAITVDCSEGRWNSDICRESELDDEFQEIEGEIDSVDRAAKLRDMGLGFGIAMVAHSSKQGDKEINNYIQEKSIVWETDKTGGMSKQTLSRYLTGDRLVLNTYKTLYDWLVTKFVLRSELDSVYDSMDVLEAKLILGVDADEDLLVQQAGLIKSQRVNGVVVIETGYKCDYRLDMCVKVE